MLRGRLVIGSLKLPFSFRCVRRGFWLLLLMLLFKRSWRLSATTKRTRRSKFETGDVQWEAAQWLVEVALKFEVC